MKKRLVPKVNGGRLLISEVIGSNLRARESIRYGESEGKTFHEIIEASSTYGWHTFDQCLAKAFETAEINEETALLYCNDRARLRRELDLLNKRKGGPAPIVASELKLEIVPPPIPSSEFTLQPGQGVDADSPDQTAAPANPSHRRVIRPRVQK
jgi:twitching motility protein PilT